MDSSVPWILEDGLRVVPQERLQNRTPEQIVGVFVPQLMEVRVQNRFSEQIVDVPVPQLLEAPVDVMLTTPQERVQNRTPEQIVDVPLPQIDR